MLVGSMAQRAALHPADDFRQSVQGQYGTILADPPWRFSNRTGKMAPEHRRLSRYATMTLDEILTLPVAGASLPQSHLYLWVPNALILEGLDVMRR
jgi:N6-adenosine-specific RNA methylase IME4